MEALSHLSEPLTLERARAVSAMAVGLVFGYAALRKLADLPRTISAIQRYRFSPARLASVLAGLVIAVEILIALSHLVGAGLPIFIPGTIVILSAFLIIVAILLIRGDERPCLCFGGGEDELLDKYALLRITILWLAEGFLYLQLMIDDGQLPVLTGDAYRDLETLLLAALIVTLVSWCLAVPKFYRASRSVRP